MSSPTDPTDTEFEAELRQLLKAEADQVSPSPEGLNLIRERIENNRGSAWLGLPWLRPAVAVAGAVLIAASVVMSTPQVRDQVLEIVPAGADSEGTPSTQNGHGNGGGVAAPEPSTDSAQGTTQPEHNDEPDGERSSPEVEEEETAEEDDLETTASCPPEDEYHNGLRPTDDQGDEDRPRPGHDENCDPSASPSDEEDEDGSDDDDDSGEGDNGGGDNDSDNRDNNGEEVPSRD